MARTEDDTLSGDGDDPPAPRILTIPRRRPYGIRKRIVADIATDWSHRIGKAVSGTTVIRCWEEYRALLKIVPEYQGSPPAV